MDCIKAPYAGDDVYTDINDLKSRRFRAVFSLGSGKTYSITLPVYGSNPVSQAWIVTAVGSYQSIIRGSWIVLWGVSQPGTLKIDGIGGGAQGLTLTALSNYDKAVELKNTYSSSDTITFTATMI